MSLIQVARYSDVKYDFKDGFARVPVLENAFDQACFAHCALQPGHSITPDVYSVTEHNQLFFFTKGKAISPRPVRPGTSMSPAYSSRSSTPSASPSPAPPTARSLWSSCTSSLSSTTTTRPVW